MSGRMSPEDAERTIWSFYWQLVHSRDRRTAPLYFGPDDPALAEAKRKEQEERIGLWQRVQKQVTRWFTPKRQKEYAEAALDDGLAQAQADASLRGKVDPRTGLPMTGNDLAMGRGVVSGVDLALDVIIPPEELAAACTAWLPPCPPDEPAAEWGQKLEHWQALAYKPKELRCETCKGLGRIKKQVGARRQGLIIISESPVETFVPCDTCAGRGSMPHWTDDEHLTVRENARQIKLVVHRLASEGYFNARPINPQDREMSDLVWEDRDGMTLGFKLTWAGYQRMLEVTQNDPELRRQAHILTLAGKELRETAPEWAKAEYKQAV